MSNQCFGEIKKNFGFGLHQMRQVREGLSPASSDPGTAGTGGCRV